MQDGCPLCKAGKHQSSCSSQKSDFHFASLTSVTMRIQQNGRNMWMTTAAQEHNRTTSFTNVTITFNKMDKLIHDNRAAQEDNFTITYLKVFNKMDKTIHDKLITALDRRTTARQWKSRRREQATQCTRWNSSLFNFHIFIWFWSKFNVILIFCNQKTLIWPMTNLPQF